MAVALPLALALDLAMAAMMLAECRSVNIKVFYVMDNVLSGELPCSRTGLVDLIRFIDWSCKKGKPHQTR